MNRRLQVTLFAVTALVAVAIGADAVVSTGAAQRAWWLGPTILSLGWVLAALLFGPAPWARTAVPGASSALYAVFYTAAHGVDDVGLLLIASAVALGAAHLSAVRQPPATREWSR